MTLAVALAVGVLIGLALGALGGGGAILTVPALVYLLGQEPTSATTGSLVVVGVASAVALVPHALAGRTRPVTGLVLGVLGTGGSLLGSRLAAGVDDTVLMRCFAAVLLVVAVLMVRRSFGGGTSEGRDDDDPDEGDDRDAAEDVSGRRDHRVRRGLQLVVVASVVGLLTGFLGVGGGFLVVPALAVVLGLPMPVAVGTSLLVIALNSGVALLGRLGQELSLDWAVIAPFTLAVVVGSLVGGCLVSRAPARHLSRAFAVLVLLVALGVGLESTVLAS